MATGSDLRRYDVCPQVPVPETSSALDASDGLDPSLSPSHGLRGLAGHAELVLARPRLGAALDVEGHRVHAGLDHDLGLGRRDAALAPRADPILAGQKAAEVELLGAIDDHVV